MSIKPIIFSGPMVRAIREGRKTQTRRVVKPKSHNSIFTGGWDDSFIHDEGNREWVLRDSHYRPGDILWVRETWAHHRCAEPRVYPKGEGHMWGTPVYKATHNALEPRCEGFGNWRSPVHMPRWAAREWLKVTGVRAQRLGDISADDAVAEGAFTICKDFSGNPFPESLLESFRDIWRSIHGTDSWDDKQWVFAYTFERVEKPEGTE